VLLKLGLMMKDFKVQLIVRNWRCWIKWIFRL